MRLFLKSRYLRKIRPKRHLKLTPEDIELRKNAILNSLKKFPLQKLKLIEAVSPYLSYLVEDIEIDLLITSYIEKYLFKDKVDGAKKLMLDKMKTNFDLKMELFRKLWKSNSEAELTIFKEVAVKKHLFRNRLVHHLFFKAHQNLKKIQEEENIMLKTIKEKDKILFDSIMNSLRQSTLEVNPAFLKNFTAGITPIFFNSLNSQIFSKKLS